MTTTSLPSCRGFTISVPGLDDTVPAWMRRIVLGDDGAVFIPAQVAGDERYVAMCAAYDDAPIVLDAPRGGRRHIFVSTRWLRQAHPYLGVLCDAVEEKAVMIRGGEVTIHEGDLA